MFNKQYYVYIITNIHNNVFYCGVSSDIIKRIYQHKNKLLEGFSSQYNLTKLVYYEIFDNPENAIIKEKQIKKWNKEWKVNLITQHNPDWLDLYDNLK